MALIDREKRNAYHREWRKKNRGRENEKQAIWRAKNRDKKVAAQVRYQRNLRCRVLNAYGARCSCCGETEIKFLSLDHVNGGGTAHRAELRSSGSNIYRWAVAHGYPATLQILCHNCNLAKGFYGSCPHQADTATETLSA